MISKNFAKYLVFDTPDCKTIQGISVVGVTLDPKTAFDPHGIFQNIQGEISTQSLHRCLLCDEPTEWVYNVCSDPSNFLITNIAPGCPTCVVELVGSPYMRVIKEFSFDSAHWLYDYDGPCQNLHGHTYKLFVHVERQLNDGMVTDFSTLKRDVNIVISELDHHAINDIEPFTEVLRVRPTAENMLLWIWRSLTQHEPFIKGLKQLDLYETPTSCARLRDIDVQYLYLNYLSPKGDNHG